MLAALEAADPFAERLAQAGLGPVRRGVVRTLQVNVTRRCNLACHHCHVESGPKRTEAIGAAEHATNPREVTLATSSRDGQAEVAVIDTGPGFGDTDRVFEPFYSTKAEGLGIGLAISRSLVEANGGRLTAESTPGRGATFRVRFPALATRT